MTYICWLNKLLFAINMHAHEFTNLFKKKKPTEIINWKRFNQIENYSIVLHKIYLNCIISEIVFSIQINYTKNLFIRRN